MCISSLCLLHNSHSLADQFFASLLVENVRKTFSDCACNELLRLASHFLKQFFPRQGKFGPAFGEFMAWKMYGGGNELRDEIYARHNMIAIDCFAIGPETSGWFKNEVKSLDQLKGMKMRFFGLGAQVMQKLGVSTQLLAAADIYPALERGVIDATEFSMPSIDQKLGFYQIAKNNYFPGWHQQISVSELLMNKKAYEALSKGNKKVLEMSLGESVLATYAETEARNPDAMNENAQKYGVKNRRWGDAELAAFEKVWF